MDQYAAPQLNLQQKRGLISLWLSFKKRCKSQLIARICKQYLATFELPLKPYSGTGHYDCKGISEQLDTEGILYAEPRFAPSLTAGGLSQQEVLELLLLVSDFCEHPQSALHTAYIICAMLAGVKALSTKMKSQLIWLQRTLEIVVAADLAGQALFATEFLVTFAEAQCSFTIHPEAAGPASRLRFDNVLIRCSLFGGLGVIQDLKAAGVALEVAYQQPSN